MNLLNLNQKPQNRIQKFAKYRRQIMKINQFQSSQEMNSGLLKDNGKSILPTVNVLMWIMGGIVIILLILVVALVYFGR